MSHNPYTPPVAIVNGASPGVLPDRPRAVTIAFWLLWVSMIVSIPFAFWRVTTLPGGVPVGTFLVIIVVTYALMLALFYWLFGSVLKGKNWARLTILWLTGLYVIFQPITLPVTLAGPLPLAILRISQVLLWVGASAFLLAPASRAWYRAIKDIS